MDTRTAAHNNLSDEQLMQRVGRDDTRAFDLLLLRHQAAVFNFLRRTVNDAAQAEDLTQECFLRLWRARSSYLPTAMFRTWIFTIARRLALDAARLNRLQTISLNEAHDGAGRNHAIGCAVELEMANRDPARLLMAQELQDVLERALQQLPDELREVVLLRDVEHFTYEQIAEIIECPLGTVKSRLNAARNRLKTAARRWYEA